MKYLDFLSLVIARIAAGAFFIIGVMLIYEVTARYFFNAPTIWAEELARLFMVWAVFAGSSSLIASNNHIRVSVLIDLLGSRARKLQELGMLLFVAAFCGIVAWYGTPIAFDSFERGRTTGSMLDIPSWWMQASIPIGFCLSLLQCCARAVRVATTFDDTSPVNR